MYPHFCVVVEIKVDVRSLPQTYHRAGEESRHQRSEVEIGGQKSEVRGQKVRRIDPDRPRFSGNVLPDTVINISVEADIPVKKLKIRNLEKHKWYTDDSFTTYYRLPAEGLEYSVQNKRVVDITYGPTKSDEKLLCKRDVPEIRY